ncbi:hypothetical protein FACS1894187_24090 [Synergistales bacterium]|nr:hypothetical protein FACS1894187_24090 [Synergistales bacterium]
MSKKLLKLASLAAILTLVFVSGAWAASWDAVSDGIMPAVSFDVTNYVSGDVVVSGDLTVSGDAIVTFDDTAPTTLAFQSGDITIPSANSLTITGDTNFNYVKFDGKVTGAGTLVLDVIEVVFNDTVSSTLSLSADAEFNLTGPVTLPATTGTGSFTLSGDAVYTVTANVSPDVTVASGATLLLAAKASSADVPVFGGVLSFDVAASLDVNADEIPDTAKKGELFYLAKVTGDLTPPAAARVDLDTTRFTLSNDATGLFVEVKAELDIPTIYTDLDPVTIVITKEELSGDALEGDFEISADSGVNVTISSNDWVIISNGGTGDVYNLILTKNTDNFSDDVTVKITATSLGSTDLLTGVDSLDVTLTLSAVDPSSPDVTPEYSTEIDDPSDDPDTVGDVSLDPTNSNDIVVVPGANGAKFWVRGLATVSPDFTLASYDLKAFVTTPASAERDYLSSPDLKPSTNYPHTTSLSFISVKPFAITNASPDGSFEFLVTLPADATNSKSFKWDISGTKDGSNITIPGGQITIDVDDPVTPPPPPASDDIHVSVSDVKSIKNGLSAIVTAIKGDELYNGYVVGTLLIKETVSGNAVDPTTYKQTPTDAETGKVAKDGKGKAAVRITGLKGGVAYTISGVTGVTSANFDGSEQPTAGVKAGKGSSGGGCDAGFAALSLLLAAPLFLRRKKA